MNNKFGKKLATALDTRTVEIMKPENISTVKFISMVEEIELDAETFKKKILKQLKMQLSLIDL